MTFLGVPDSKARDKHKPMDVCMSMEVIGC